MLSHLAWNAAAFHPSLEASYARMSLRSRRTVSPRTFARRADSEVSSAPSYAPPPPAPRPAPSSPVKRLAEEPARDPRPPRAPPPVRGTNAPNVRPSGGTRETRRATARRHATAGRGCAPRRREAIASRVDRNPSGICGKGPRAPRRVRDDEMSQLLVSSLAADISSMVRLLSSSTRSTPPPAASAPRSLVFQPPRRSPWNPSRPRASPRTRMESRDFRRRRRRRRARPRTPRARSARPGPPTLSRSTRSASSCAHIARWCSARASIAAREATSRDGALVERSERSIARFPKFSPTISPRLARSSPARLGEVRARASATSSRARRFVVSSSRAVSRVAAVAAAAASRAPGVGGG